MKARRHHKILELIQNFRIETQEELAEKLEQAGFAGVQVLPDLAGKDRVVRADLRPDARTEKGQGNTGGCDV